MIKTERTNIIPFDMKYLDDYFNLFDAEITKHQCRIHLIIVKQQEMFFKDLLMK